MRIQQFATITFYANVYPIKVKIFTNNCYFSKTITAKDNCLCLRRGNIIRIIVYPLNSGYTGKLYIQEFVCNDNILTFKFSKQKVFNNIYKFTLTDLNYGLNINGTLNFTKKTA